jgi:hypothetical protein
MAGRFGALRRRTWPVNHARTQTPCGSLGRPAIVQGVTDQHVSIAVDLAEYPDRVVMRVRDTRSPD